MANAHYPLGLENFANGVIDWTTDDIIVILLDNTYTFNTAHEFIDDLTGEVDRSPVLAGKTNVEGVLDATDPVFASLVGNDCERYVIAMDTGNDLTAPLLAYFDTMADTSAFLYSPNGADFTLEFNASGIMKI